ncbi:MAG: methyltransferase [Muribaculum sp.]|nr:methyltransferase [Muribaculum sp.]
MKTTKTAFRFKHFSLSHHRSAMKVGVDGVLAGCWAQTFDGARILDVGTGCGLIALIMAQRFPLSEITGIEIDIPSAQEASENVAASPWPERVRILQASFPDSIVSYCNRSSGYDLVVSNPPFFNSGITDASTPREKARHQGILSPISLLTYSPRILREGGMLAMVVPFDEIPSVEEVAAQVGYVPVRKCLVRGHSGAPWKRGLLQWQLGCIPPSRCEVESLTLEASPGVPTDEYRTLCKDFYLKF